MPETVSQIIWWWLTGALLLISTMLFGFIRFLLKEYYEQMKQMKLDISTIVTNTSVIPGILETVKTHTGQINEIEKKIIKLESQNENPKT